MADLRRTNTTPLNQSYRTFRLYRNDPTGYNPNVPNELYHTHNITVGGFSTVMIRKESVNFVGYAGGFNPVYAGTMELLRERIDARTKGMNDDGSFPDEDDDGGAAQWAQDRLDDRWANFCERDGPSWDAGY